MDEDALNLEIIVNNKASRPWHSWSLLADDQVTDGGQAVIQLETGQSSLSVSVSCAHV